MSLLLAEALGSIYSVSEICLGLAKRARSGRFVRHPSYTGALMAFFGLGLTLGNFASLAVLSVPTCAVFLWRIRVEEAALLEGLGPTHRDYMSRTKRLIPAIY